MEDSTLDPADLDELIDASKGGKHKRIAIIAKKGRVPMNALHDGGWAAIHYAAQASIHYTNEIYSRNRQCYLHCIYKCTWNAEML